MQHLFGVGFPVVGMLHLLPLPGAPGQRPLREVVERALAEADVLAHGGCHGLLLENYGDAPFEPGPAAPHTVAAMARVAAEVRRAVGLPLGINVLRNDAAAALGIAVATGALFIRVNVHLGNRWTDQGLIEGQAHQTLRLRQALDAGQVRIWADVAVKHSRPVDAETPAEAARELAGRGLADALIVSGHATGRPVDEGELQAVKAAVALPVLLGSGVSAENIDALRSHADGAIVGTAFKEGGIVSPARVRRLLERLR